MGIGKLKKTTTFGGLITILIFGTAIAYFVYLNYQYANNMIMPKITQLEKKIKKDFNQPLAPDFISFDIYLDDEDVSLMQY